MKIIKVIFYLKESERYSCSLVLVSSEDLSRMRAELGGERGLVVGLWERCKMGITEQGSLPSSPFTPASSTARRQLWVWQDSWQRSKGKKGTDSEEVGQSSLFPSSIIFTAWCWRRDDKQEWMPCGKHCSRCHSLCPNPACPFTHRMVLGQQRLQPLVSSW